MSGNKGGRHMAGGRNRQNVSSERRREALQDRYTYEEPSRGSREFEDVASYSSSRKKKEDQRELKRQKNQKKKMSAGKKAAIIIVLVLLAVIGGGVYYVFGYMLKDLTVAPITKDKVQLGIHSEVQTDESIKNIALFGLDARNDEFEGRSDAIMILTVDNKHGSIKMASILRDSNVSIQMKDESGNAYYIDDKITHAYAYGGPDLAVQTLNRNFSLDIEDYVTVNFIKMAEIVDACGGVKINITYDEMNEINNNLGLQINESSDAAVDSSDYLYEDGDVLLNGNQAVAYARIRHIDSDDMRASRQQTVLKALIEQARGKSKLEYPEMIRKLMPMCKTSLSISDVIAMAPIMLTDFTVKTMSVPGEDETPSSGINGAGGWVYMYDLEAAAKHINQFIYEDNASSQVYLDDEVKRVCEIALSGGYASGGGSGTIPSDDYSAEWTPPAPPVSSADPNNSSGGEPTSSVAPSSGTEDPVSSSPTSSGGGESSGGSSSGDPGNDPGGNESGSSNGEPADNPNIDPGGDPGEDPNAGGGTDDTPVDGGGENLEEGEGTAEVTP